MTTIFDLTPEERAKFRAFLHHEAESAAKMAEQVAGLPAAAVMEPMVRKLKMDAAACRIVDGMLGAADDILLTAEQLRKASETWR